MKQIEFILNWEINSNLSLNAIYRGKNKYERSRQVKKYHDSVILELIAQRVPRKMFENPVRIDFLWNSHLDLDNHGYLTKLIIDGLKGYLLRDDNKKYVQEINHAYWLGKGVKIKIYEI